MRTLATYLVTSQRELRGEILAEIGDTVYECNGHDYGSANMDTMYCGERHISVTTDPEGGYPFFTIPLSSLKLIEGDS